MALDWALDLIGRFFLFFTSAFFVIPVSVAGYWVFRKEMFGRLIFLILFSMIFSLYLKSIWQVPLPSWLKSDTWAFPSGHMLFTVVFYGGMACELRQTWMSLGGLLVMGGVAWALMYFGYHEVRDILGGIGFGGLILIAYYFCRRLSFVKENLPLGGLILSPLTFLFIYLVPKYFSYVYEVQGQLMGFSLGWFLWNKYCRPELSKPEKVKALLVSLLGALICVGIGFLIPKTAALILGVGALMGFSIAFPGFGLLCKKHENKDKKNF